MGKLPFSVATFNGLVGAFAECGLIDKVTVLFDQMKTEGLTPTNATWTRWAKGHCLEGNINKAIDVMDQMRETSLHPDEIFYNSLLDGCAEHGYVDEALEILERMENDKICASKYTLSILAKLMARAKRSSEAFEWVEKLAKKYRIEISPNIYVTILTACIGHGDHNRAVLALERGMKRGLKPEPRVFTSVVKSCLQAGPRIADAVSATRQCLATIREPRTMQGLIEKPTLREALLARAAQDGKDAVQPLLEELRNGTGGW